MRWNASLFPEPPAEMDEIAATLLSWGGEEVVWMDENPYLLGEMTHRLELREGPAGRLLSGEASQCHRNSASNLTHKGWRIWTGWALSSDGLWRPHSWNQDDNGKLVETTEHRVSYGGMLLDEAETVVFAANEDALSEIFSADPQRWLKPLGELLAVAKNRPTPTEMESSWSLLAARREQAST